MDPRPASPSSPTETVNLLRMRGSGRRLRPFLPTVAAFMPTKRGPQFPGAGGGRDTTGPNARRGTPQPPETAVNAGLPSRDGAEDRPDRPGPPALTTDATPPDDRE